MASLMENITELESIDRLELVWPKIEQIMSAMGLDFLIYAMANHNDTQFYYYDGTDMPAYRDAGFYDPFLEYCCHSYDVTYTGIEFLRDHVYLNERATSHINNAGENGFKSGIGIPIRLVGSSRYGGFNLGSSLNRDAFVSKFEPKLDSIRLLCVLAQRHIEHLMDQKNILCGPHDLQTTETDHPKLKRLTDRERQILRSISNGVTRIECANEFNLSEGTVSTHIKNIYRKLGVRNRVEAARFENSNTPSGA